MAHNDLSQLIKKLDSVKEQIGVGKKYFHYKHPDQLYNILRIGIIEKTEEICVIYEAEYGEKVVWVRPLDDFLAKVKLEDGREVDRFTKID
jgi:hypothetical protein